MYISLVHPTPFWGYSLKDAYYGYGTEYFNGIAVENVKIGQFIADIYGYLGPTDDISGIVDNPY